MKKAYLQPTPLDKSQLAYIKKLIPSFEPKLSKEKEVIPVCEPDMGPKELEYISQCIKGGWISSLGQYVNLFEKRFAKFCNTKYSVTTTSGTHALHLALAGLGITEGDEVIVPTFTMIATANAATYLGAKAVFVDARPDTWNIDETKIEAAITKKTKAIIVVHTYGHPAEMDTINRIAKKHKIFVIEDAAESHGAKYKGKVTGSLSDAGCFSFYANKMITTGEGGMITTNNAKLHKLLYKLHNHAFADTIHFWHEYLGYNYRMTNFQAAMGCAQMERIRHMINARRRNAKTYMKFLKDIPGIQLPVELDGCINTYWMFGVTLDDTFPLTRDELRDYLAQNGIETRTFFIPLHLQPIYFKNEYKNKFPVAERLGKNGLYFPSASTLRQENIEFIAAKIREAYNKNN